MLRRGCLAFPDASRHLFKGLALLQRRQGSIFTFFFFRLRLFQAHAVKAFHFLPSCLQHGFSLCREGMAPAVQNRRYRLKPVDLGRGRKEPCGDQRQYIPLPGRKLR